MSEAGPRPEAIGERLRRLRLERRLSQRELASPGVSYAYISRIEAGTRQPSVKALRRLAQKLGVSADYLETGSQLGQKEQRELRLADAELRLRLRLADDTSAAESELAAVLQDALEAGDAQHATRARLGLGLAAAQTLRHHEAIALLQTEVGTPTTVPAARPDAFAALARSYSAVGTPQQGVELLEACLADVTEAAPDDHAVQVRYASYLSAALVDAGDAARAESVLADVLGRAERVADAYTRVRGYWSIARGANDTGDQATALDYYRRAIALADATDDARELVRAHLARAGVLINGDRAAEAGPHLELAERLLGAYPDPADEALLRTALARRAIREGDATEATESARAALSLLGETDPGERGAAWLVLAEALVLQRELPAADDAFRRAIEFLEQGSRWKDCARAHSARARMLRADGRETEAMEAFEQAAAVAERSVDVRAR